MSCPATPFAIANAWAYAFTQDEMLAAWAQRVFGRAFFVQIGADMRRLPDSENTPFLLLFPETSVTGPQRDTVEAEVGIVAGIEDGGLEPDENGITVMSGLVRLNELCPLLESAMRNALPKARLQGVSTEFVIMQYPLCEAFITVTVEHELPAGSRF